MNSPTPHPLTMPTGQLLAALGSTATSETTFDLVKLLDGIIQHGGLWAVLNALANVAKVYALADRQSGEPERSDAWLRIEIVLLELQAAEPVEIVSQR